MSQLPPKCRRGRRLIALAALALLTGCASYTDQTTQLRTAWTVGDFPSAAKIAAEAAKQAPSRDAVLWNLEAGTAASAAGDPAASMAAFQQADNQFDYWDTQPEISISRETAALLVNQTTLPYRGRDYDRIMESTYQALNYLKLGKYDEARVELNRALERQRTAVDKNAKRIEAAKDAAEKSAADGGYNVQAAQNDPRFQQQLQQVYGPLAGFKFYSDYVNPFTTYLQGVCLMARPQSPSDYESARVDFERVRAMIGNNAYIDADCALATKLAGGTGTMPALTYVIFETGLAPTRQETSINIPVFLASKDVPYFGVAFPRLEFNGQFDPGLVVQATGQPPLGTALLCDMDAVVAQEFRNDLPEVVVKTLISSGAKAAALFGLHQETRKNDLADTLTQLGGLLYQAATNHADLRTWSTLPKQFLFCRLPTPPDHKLSLTSDATHETRVVDLTAGGVTMVYVKSAAAGNHLAIQVFNLR
ncbi:MAG TPA: hypothetical protein VHC95_00125 [Opitutales bacterium]|nr:hypothetical protein [Opitutales bacterium]